MSCKSCKFAKEGETNPKTLTREMVCQYNPPQAFPVPTQQGLMFVSVFPTVTKDMSCSKHELNVNTPLGDTLRKMSI